MMFVVGHAGYPFDVLVAIGEKHERVVGWLKRHSDLCEQDADMLRMRTGGKGRTVMLTSGQSVIQLLRLDTADDAGHLAHEVFHAVEFLMRRIGITLCEASDEAFAYAIGNLTYRIHEQVAKQRKGRKR